jgi:DNA-binding GntR family transcriptional regulator
MHLEQWLLERWGKLPARAKRNADVRFPTAYEQFMLRISRQTPVVDVELVKYDQDGNAIALSRIVTPAEYFNFVSEYDDDTLEPHTGPSLPS